MLTYNVFDVSVYGEQQGALTHIASFASQSDARRFFFRDANAHMRLVYGYDVDSPWIQRIHGSFEYSDNWA